MNKKLLTVVFAAATLAAGVAHAEVKAFKVNGQQVTVAEQQEVINAYKAQGVKADAQLENAVKQKFIVDLSLLQEAKKSKVESSDLYKKQLALVKDQLAVEVFRANWVKSHPVPQAELQKLYDAEKTRYGDKEYDVSVIAVKSEKEAKDIIAQLNKGANFADLAKKFSLMAQNKDNGGELGWVIPGNLGSIGVAFSQLSAGSVGQAPVAVQGGWTVVKLNKVRPAQNFPTFAQLKPQLENAVLQQKWNEYLVSLAKKAKVQ